MIKVVGVCFEKSNKIYYFLPNDNICNLNDFVIDLNYLHLNAHVKTFPL